MPNIFSIQVGDFSGPLDLLLQLIEKRKLHISEISLAKVTEDYLNYLNQSSNLIPKKDLAEFLVVASTLMVIKSASLLPETNPLDKANDDLSAEELTRRLAAYDLLKRTTQELKPLLAQNKLWFKRYRPKTIINFTPSPDLTIFNLNQSAKYLLQTLPELKILPKVTVKKILSLEEVMTNLSERLQKRISISFTEASGANQAEKIDIIMNFLGLLELVKNGLFKVSQTDQFADINISQAD